MDWLTDPGLWASLLTLTALEIVLGIDNLVFIAILAGRLPAEQQDRARQIGLVLALTSRLGLLASIAWIISLTQPLFELFGHPISWRDIVLIAGGLFLLYKGTREIHHTLEGDEPQAEEEHANQRTSFAGVITHDHAVRYRVLAGQRDHGSGHGQYVMGDGERHRHCRGDHAGGLGAAGRFCSRRSRCSP